MLSATSDHPPVCGLGPDRAVCSSSAVAFRWDAFTSASSSDHRAAPACAVCGPCGLQKEAGPRMVLAGYQLKAS